MYRIDNPTAAPLLPAPAAAGTPGYFTDGVPGSTPATVVPADWLNAVQEEIATVIANSGQTLSKANRGQLYAALGRVAPATARSVQGTAITAGYNGTVTVSLTVPQPGYILAIGSINVNNVASSAIVGTLRVNGAFVASDSTLSGQSHSGIVAVGAGAVSVTFQVTAASATGINATYMASAAFFAYP